jgi:hypothetical protein
MPDLLVRLPSGMCPSLALPAVVHGLYPPRIPAKGNGKLAILGDIMVPAINGARLHRKGTKDVRVQAKCTIAVATREGELYFEATFCEKEEER